MSILQKTSLITEQILTALTNADKEILFQMYYIHDDTIFAKYVSIFIQKAKQGVSIHCLFDALGANQIRGSITEKILLDAGVHIQYFNWLTPWAAKNKHILYFRNHKRALIIDKVSVHIGGWCIGEKTEHWIDGYISTTDPQTVQKSTQDFWNMYTYAHKTQIRFKHEARYTYTPTDFMSYTYQAPMIRGRYISYNHKKLMRSATKRIVLVSPYFAPVYTLKRALHSAKKKGVVAEIFLPKKTDIHTADLVAQTYVYGLLKRGVSIYTSDTMLHAKVALFDDVLYIGSVNLDSVSLRYNFENGIYTKDSTSVTDFLQDIEILKSNCTKLTLEMWQKRSLWQKFLDRFMKMFRMFV